MRRTTSRCTLQGSIRKEGKGSEDGADPETESVFAEVIFIQYPIPACMVVSVLPPESLGSYTFHAWLG